jgi:hypothetical protein
MLQHLSAPDLTSDHLTFLIRKNDEEVSMGSIEAVKDWNDVRVLLPVFVAVHPVTGKLRVIFDGRALNVYLLDAHGAVKYETLRDALLLRARVATKLDLQSAFRHVRVHDDDCRYLGFVLDNKVYRYRCLPFGCNWSPALYARMLQPAIDAIRKLGIRIIWYVDDILVVADSREELDAALLRVMQTLAAHGWKVAADKTYCHAYTTIPFLGLCVSFDQNGFASLTVPRSKRDRTVNDLVTVLDTGFSSVNMLQKILGRMNFIRLVIPELGFCRAPLDGAVAAALRRYSSTQIPIIGHLRESMLAILTLLQSDDILDRKATARPQSEDVRVRHVLYSDASAFGWGVLLVDPRGPFKGPPGLPGAHGWSRSGNFSPWEMSMSSAAREIRAILYGIIGLDLRNAVLRWHSDSTSAVAAIHKWASSAQGVADALNELFSELQRRNLDVDISHVRRDLELMPVADWLSRRGWRDRQAEWSFAKADVAKISSALGLTCSGDLFASSRNHHFPVFCSRFLEARSRGDGMFVPWWDRPWWAFPPRSLRSRILQRLVSYLRTSQASLSQSSRRRAINMILIISPVQPTDPDAALWDQLVPVIHKSVVVVARQSPSVPSSSVTSSATTAHSQPRPPQLLPHLRLVGDQGRPAHGPPPWPLTAYRIRIVTNVA